MSGNRAIQRDHLSGVPSVSVHVSQVRVPRQIGKVMRMRRQAGSGPRHREETRG